MSLNCRRCVEPRVDDENTMVAGKNVPAVGCYSCQLCDDCECFPECTGKKGPYCLRCMEAQNENGQKVAGKNVIADGCRACGICKDCECFDTCDFFMCAMCNVGGFEKKHSFHDFSKSNNEYCHGCWPFAPECKEDDKPKDRKKKDANKRKPIVKTGKNKPYDFEKWLKEAALNPPRSKS